jgi:hypothetical protein
MKAWHLEFEFWCLEVLKVLWRQGGDKVVGSTFLAVAVLDFGIWCFEFPKFRWRQSCGASRDLFKLPVAY